MSFKSACIVIFSLIIVLMTSLGCSTALSKATPTPTDLPIQLPTSIPTETPDPKIEEAAYLANLDKLMTEWNDGFDLAQTTPRTSLSNQIAKLQDIKQRIGNMVVPNRYTRSHKYLVWGIDEYIQGFLAFLGEKSNLVISAHIDIAQSFQDASITEMAADVNLPPRLRDDAYLASVLALKDQLFDRANLQAETTDMAKLDDKITQEALTMIVPSGYELANKFISAALCLYADNLVFTTDYSVKNEMAKSYDNAFLNEVSLE